MLSNRVKNMKPSGIRKFFSLAAKMDRCLDLSIGQPDFDVPAEMKEVAKRAIDSGKNSYTPSLGIESARSAIRTKYNINDSKDYDVIITSGVSGGLLLSFAAILDEGDEILIPDPYFVGYNEIAKLVGAKPVLFETHPNFVPDIENLEKLVTEKTKAIVIGNPSNPTGYVLTAGELASLVSFAKKKGLYLIFDEIYECFSYDGVHLRPDLDDRIIILNGLSKSHAMTGWRLGWIVASMELIEEMQKLQQFSYVCAPAPFQHVIPEALKYFDQEIFDSYKNKRNLAYDKLSKKFEIVKPGGAFYIYPKVNGMTASQFVEKSISNSVLVIPGTVFSKRDTHFRISFAVSDEILDEATDILVSLVD